nr:immunoglobulin heavy chain junction region [Mus musculus]MBK4184685.1 immunoglobulin heavy chain junction region [Mus musculus]MBK4184859.1 immunoglobulin heavy chain junction region [Mus musculus]MBK4185529.1 immunoglobulin heavy chain junction region [Mus musculus]MBK4187221.1 immunoglobulin heavy chain junction region [Mus musculus]
CAREGAYYDYEGW